MDKFALNLPLDHPSGGKYTSPGYYIVDQNGSPMDGPYDTPSVAMANLKGRAGVNYIGGPETHLNQPFPEELRTVVGGLMSTGATDPNYEAKLVQALSRTANQDEQRTLMGALEDFRKERSRAIAAQRQIDFDATTRLTRKASAPITGSHSFHTGATDWLGDITTDDSNMEVHMLTQGSLFYTRCDPAVKAEPREYLVQGLGLAQREAGQYSDPDKAIGIFMNHIAQLNRVDIKKLDIQKLAVDELLPWGAPPEKLPPISSDWGNMGSENQNTDVNQDPSISSVTEGLNNGSIDNGNYAENLVTASFLFEGPHQGAAIDESPYTLEELAQATGPNNTMTGQNNDATPEPNDDGALGGALKGNGPVLASQHVGKVYTNDQGVRYVPKGQKAPTSFKDPATCGVCGRTWDDGHSTGVTPVPSGRCPFEYSHKNSSLHQANQYIKKQGDEWVILQKGTGKVLSHHDSEEKANAAFSAMEMNKHGGSLDTKEGSRAFTYERPSYEEYLSRLSEGAYPLPRDLYAGSMAAVSPSKNDPSLPPWGKVPHNAQASAHAHTRTASDYHRPPEPDGIKNTVSYLNTSGVGPTMLGDHGYGGDENYQRDYDIGYHGEPHGLKTNEAMSEHTLRGHSDSRAGRKYDPEGTRYNWNHGEDLPEHAYAYPEGGDQLSKASRQTATLKMSPEHREVLRQHIEPFDTDEHRNQYLSGKFPRAEFTKDLDKRYRWDLYHASKVDRTLDPYEHGYNDSHIDSALKSIVPPLMGKTASRKSADNTSDPTGKNLATNPAALPQGWDPYSAWVQSGEAASSLPLAPTNSVAENFSQITDFPETGPSMVPSSRTPMVQENATADKDTDADDNTLGRDRQANRQDDRTVRVAAQYFRHDPTDYSFETVPMHEARPGDITTAGGGYKAIVQEVRHHRPGEHDHSPIKNDLHATEVVTDKGSRWGGLGNYNNDLGVYRPREAAKEKKERPGFETGGNGSGTPGAYVDRSSYAESPQSQADDTEGYEQAYSSGRPIDYTDTGEDVLGTVPVEGYEYNADHPSGEMWPFEVGPVGNMPGAPAAPRGAADVANLPTPGAGVGYPQPQVAKNAKLESFLAGMK